MRKNCKTFEQWVRSQYDEFMNIHNKVNPNIYSLRTNAQVYSTRNSVKCFIYNEYRNKTGFASVDFNAWDDPTLIAIGLAWANYKKEDIPENLRGKWY